MVTPRKINIIWEFVLWMAIIPFFTSCQVTTQKNDVQIIDTLSFITPVERPVDTLLTPETRAMWMNLKKLQGTGIIFGQQDATLTGVDWKNDENRSDVRDVTGTHPALYGWEIAGAGSEANTDSIPFTVVQQRIVEAFERGGINTVTWHMNNPVTGGSSMDVFPALQQILPDSSRFDHFKSELEHVARFFHTLRNSRGILVPIIFRPFHENNGNWFWWGKGRCTPGEYIRLWQFTVTYLRDSLHVHNLLYVYSTDMFENQSHYLERYPGDEWVDILGCENYWDFQAGASVSNGVAQLNMLVEMAMKRKKLAALTECGFEGVPVKNWWTQFLLEPIKSDSLAQNISYLMVWRNANRKLYYTPFPGQKSFADFIAFERDSFTIFEKDLINVYKQ